MDNETKIILQANRLLGEFIGTLEGIRAWNIPKELDAKLENTLKELRNIQIGPNDFGKDVTPAKTFTPPTLSQKEIKARKRKIDFWCQCILFSPPLEYSYFKVCPCCNKRDNSRQAREYRS